MKYISLLVLFIFCQQADAQRLALGIAGGSGLPFMIEDFDGRNPTDYSNTLIVEAKLTYQTQSYFNYQLRLQHFATESRFNDVNGGSISYPEVFSTLFIAEHLKTSEKKLQHGFGFGAGLTLESVSNFFGPTSTRYLSAQVHYIAALSITDKVKITAEPQLLWTDMVSTFRYNFWTYRGEGLSGFLTVGLAFSL